VFAGDALEYEVSSGLTATLVYRFRVQAVSEYAKLSLYSEISEFYAAPLPDTITFPANPFTELGASFLKFTWNQPSISLALKLPILSYKLYYDASYLLSGQFTLLDTVTSYD
jgi:fibronectin type 3 domain-containing protein